MESRRRNFLKKISVTAIGLGIPVNTIWSRWANFNWIGNVRINPWLEISRSAYLHNAETISKLANGKPILAVLKNNAYGIGDVEVAHVLDKSPHIEGFAMVKDERCLKLRENGVKKTILLMGDFAEDLGPSLVESNITLSIFSKESNAKIIALATQSKIPVKVHLYFDTGLGRMGMPHHKSLDWVKELHKTDNVRITGAFSTLTTPKDFAMEQIDRFKSLLRRIETMGVSISTHHLAPSQSILELEESHMNLVRPGILVHGTFPLSKMHMRESFPLKPTFRLRSRVVRVEKLVKGETIGFSRFYELKQDEWIATIPIGWADGYNSAAENGAKVLINETLYDVVNVNASHCNVVVGREKNVSVGDTATLIGPDRVEITPEGFSNLISGHNYLQINYKESIPKQIYDDFD